VNVRKEQLEELFLRRLDALTVRPVIFNLLAAAVHDA